MQMQMQIQIQIHIQIQTQIQIQSVHLLPQLQNCNPKFFRLSSRLNLQIYTFVQKIICKKNQTSLFVSLCVVYKWKSATPITFSKMRMPAKPTIANRPFHRSALAVKGPFLHA